MKKSMLFLRSFVANISQHSGAGSVDEKVRHTQRTINELEGIIERGSIKQDATLAIRASEKELDPLKKAALNWVFFLKKWLP